MARLRLEGSTRLDRFIAYIAPGLAAKRQAARLRFELASQFRGADSTRLLSDWLTSALGIVNPMKYEMETLRLRSQELNRNNPIAASITDTLTVNVIGQGLQPQSRLRAKELGVSEEEAQFLRRQTENIFDRWQKQEKFRAKQATTFRKIVEDGEIITNLPMRKEPWRFLKRSLEMIEADRLGTPFGKQGVFQGIEVDQVFKEPQKYWIRRANLTTNEFERPRYEWVGMPARDSRGRPLLLHNFLVKRPGQLRGIPFLAPALTHFKHMSDYFSAAVVAQKLAACVALVITTTDPVGVSQAVRQTGLTGTSLNNSQQNNLEQWEPASILRLGIGEDAKMIDPKGVQESFGAFMEVGHRILGTIAGLPYELLLKDFSKTNYSSARAALLEGWRWFMFLRSWFGHDYLTPIWDLVLEEAYLTGKFQARNFYQNQDEYCRVQWIGSGRGMIDPVKEVGAAIAAIAAGLSTHARELASQGEDWEEIFEQLMRERQYAQALGLVFTIENKAPAGQAEPQEGEEKPAVSVADLTKILGLLVQLDRPHEAEGLSDAA